MDIHPQLGHLPIAVGIATKKAQFAIPFSTVNIASTARVDATDQMDNMVMVVKF